MSRNDLIEKLKETLSEDLYSKKLIEKALNARNAGYFTAADAKTREMGLLTAEAGSLEAGQRVSLFWLVDESDGVVVDARFQVFGSLPLIAAAEIVSNFVVSKHMQQIRIQTQWLYEQLAPLPARDSCSLQLIIEAISFLLQQGHHLPSRIPHAPSLLEKPLETQQGDPHWPVRSHTEKLALIEELLDAEIRPYIALDEGGITIESLSANDELTIAYQGACTSCYSSIGSTLHSIQEILQSRLHSNLHVIPKLDTLQL